jgi:ketosteroid isomerase-like protein
LKKIKPMNRIRLLFVVLAMIMSSVHAADSVTKTLVWPDGTRYVGGVKDGKRSGKGTIFWQDGTRFVGQFENDMRNGPGTMILPDGTVYTGFFRDDELVDTETTLAASRNRVEAGMDEETVASVGDTPMPVEADSLRRPVNTPVDEHDLLPVPADEESSTFVDAAADEKSSALPDTAAEEEPGTLVDTATDNEPGALLDTAGDEETPASVDAAVEVPEPAIQQSTEPADSPETEATAVAEVMPQTSEAPITTDVTAITDDVKETLVETVDGWAAAWSDQDVNAYLAHYADDFAVPGRQTRRNWEALRRTRLNRPRFIEVDIDYQGFELVDTNVVEVFFRQAYRANTYSDLTDKVLRLRREDDDWKILIERSR